MLVMTTKVAVKIHGFILDRNGCAARLPPIALNPMTLETHPCECQFLHRSVVGSRTPRYDILQQPSPRARPLCGLLCETPTVDLEMLSMLARRPLVAYED